MDEDSADGAISFGAAKFWRQNTTRNLFKFLYFISLHHQEEFYVIVTEAFGWFFSYENVSEICRDCLEIKLVSATRSVHKIIRYGFKKLKSAIFLPWTERFDVESLYFF